MNADLKIAIIKKLERILNNIDDHPSRLLIDIQYFTDEIPSINYNIKELIHKSSDVTE